MKRFICLLFFTLVMVYSFHGTEVFAGATFYVDQNHPQASDRNPGTEQLPWETIQHAADAVRAGDAIRVKPGSYDERAVITRGGVPGNPVIYKAEGAVVSRGFTVLADYVRIEGFEITDTPYHWREGNGIFIEGKGIQIVGNQIHHTQGNGISCSDQEPYCSDAVIRSNAIRYADGSGIVIWGANNLVEGNDISHSLKISSRDADGIRFFGRDHVIRRNFIHDITEAEAPGAHTDCFQTFDDSKPPTNNILIEGNICRNVDHQCLMASAKTKRQSSRIIFRNNVCDNNGWQAVYILQIPGSEIVNNTFAEKIRSRGIILKDGARDTSVLNNIFYGSYLPYEIDSSSLPGFRADYNLKFPGSGTPWKEPHGLWNRDPQFVDPEKRDFQLRPESPAKDAGFSLPEVTTDLEGNSRPQGAGYDIGAYEYTQKPPQVPTAIPEVKPVVWLMFEDDLNDGVAEDSSGNGFSANCRSGANCPMFVPGGGYDGGGAYFFDGAKSYLDLGTSRFGIDRTNAFTISLWIKPTGDGLGSFYDPIIRRGQYAYPLGMDFDRSGRIWSQLRTNKNYRLASKSSMPLGTWTHLAVTYKNGSRVLFINGVADASETVEGNLNWGYSSSIPNTFLGKTPGRQEYFKGLMDEVRIFDCALTPVEIQNLFHSSMVVPVPSAPGCGFGSCDKRETCKSCSKNCGACALDAEKYLGKNRAINWDPGIPGGIPVTPAGNNVIDHGAMGNGFADDTQAIKNAINAASLGTAVYLPPGKYRVTSKIQISKGVVLRGAGWDQTTIVCDFSNAHCIAIEYGYSPRMYTPLVSGYQKGSTSVRIQDLSGFIPGGYVEFRQDNDPALMRGMEADRNVGQFAKVIAVDSTTKTITIDKPLHFDYHPAMNPGARHLKMVEKAGIEDLRLEMVPTSGSSLGNIAFIGAANSWMKNVWSHMAYGGHVYMKESYANELRGNVFQDTWQRGGGGKGYGIRHDMRSTDNLYTDNIYWKLRHSMILSYGANGNVFSYSYSADPAAGDYADQNQINYDWIYPDSSTHGNYPYMNLWEGNWFQQAIMDNVHGTNASTTLFRNKITRLSDFVNEERGIRFPFVAISENNYYHNVIGNEIGLPGQQAIGYAGRWTPTLCGTGSVIICTNLAVDETIYVHGNYDYLNEGFRLSTNRNGWEEELGGENASIPYSLYLSGPPYGWPASYPWPPFGPDKIRSGNTIPAKQRFDQLRREGKL